jgi:ubiquinone/menaquinone biosynthesis C-methylase UbiE
MRAQLGTILSTATVALVVAAVAVAPAQDERSEINKPFQNPDVAAYIKRFESESREVYVQREAIVAAVGLKPGQAVADIGAGTGLFARRFADIVGPEGKVYAVDISRPFLDHIAREARQRGHAHIQTIQGTQDSTNLPAGSVDAAFLSDTYHHLEQHERILASIHRALRPGGRLVVVEFDRRKGVSTDFVLKHVRADKAQFLSEITAAGFEPIQVSNPPALKENFFAVFRKREREESTR